MRTSSNKFDQRPTWGVAIENMAMPSPSKLALFDQSGYDLCPLEVEYALANGADVGLVRDRKSLCKPWITSDAVIGAHINHSFLLERKGYHGYALEQLSHWQPGNKLLNKMIKLKPKWGIDISIDYVDDSHVFELFHFEWDDFNVWTVEEMKYHIEELIYSMDWEHFAKIKISRKHEWAHLDFVGQSEWTTKYLSLPKERFNLVPWIT